MKKSSRPAVNYAKAIVASLCAYFLIFFCLSSNIAIAAPLLNTGAVLNIATDTESGIYHALGSVLTSCLNSEENLSNLSVITSNGSSDNVRMIVSGEAQLALVQSDDLYAAHNSLCSFSDSPECNAMWVAGIYNEPIHILAKAGIRSVSDLKGKRVCVGESGSGTEKNSWRVLNAVGIAKEDIVGENLNEWDGLDALKAGSVDAVFVVARAYTPSIVSYAATNDGVNLISLSDSEISAIRDAYPFFAKDCIKTNTYKGQNEAAKCVAIQTALVAASDLSEDVVYRITRALFEKKSELEEGHALFGYLSTTTAVISTTPLHFGAITYYNEVGSFNCNNADAVSVRVRDVLTLTPEYLSENSPKHTWASSNDNIATVKSAGGFSSGNVTGISPGSAVVTALDDGVVIGQFKVKVVDAPLPSEISIQQSYTIWEGTELDLVFELTPESATSLYYVECDDYNVLSCDTTGGHTGVRLCGLKEGTANITIHASNNIVLSSVVHVLSAGTSDQNTQTGVSVTWDNNQYKAAAHIINDLPSSLFGKTVILHTNDMHGNLYRLPKLATLKSDFESLGATVLLVDAGDFLSGDPLVYLSRGKSAVALMNAAGYDYVALGNHEFDYGWDVLQEDLIDAEFKVLSNVKYNDRRAFDICLLEENEQTELKVGFFGLTTPETATKERPSTIQCLSWPSGADLIETGQAAIDNLKASGADVVIGITHLGVESGNIPNSSRDFYGNVTGVDFLIDGHSHTVMTAGEGDEPIQSAGNALSYVGVIIIDNATKKIVSNYLFDLACYSGEDSAVKALVNEIEAKTEREYQKTFAVSDYILNGANKASRLAETNLGDMIADAMLWYITKDGTGDIDVPTKKILAVINGGFIRDDIDAGNISKKVVKTALPFDNTVAVVYVRGEKLLEALEASTHSLPIGGFPQVSGIQFTIDDTKPFSVGEQYPNSSYFAPKTIDRVTIENVNGRPFDPNATYAVVTVNFLAYGGDTYYAFASSDSKFDTSIPMNEAVCEYIQTVLHGKIGVEYANPQGRITILTKESLTASGRMGDGVLSWAYQGYLRRLTLSGVALRDGSNILVAEYNKNGQLLRTHSCGSSGSVTEEIAIILNKSAEWVKLFLLDESYTPICQCAEICQRN